MSEHIEQIRRENQNGVTTKTTKEVDDDIPMKNESGQVEQDTTATRVIWLVAGIIIALLAFRFVLMLLGANLSNMFAHIVFTLSYPFALPFFGLFGYSLHYGSSHFELSTLVAIVVYALIAAGLSRLMTIQKPASR